MLIVIPLQKVYFAAIVRGCLKANGKYKIGVIKNEVLKI